MWLYETIDRMQIDAAKRDEGAAPGDPMADITLAPMLNPSRHDFRVLYQGAEVATAKPDSGTWYVQDVRLRCAHTDLKSAIRSFLVSAGIGMRRN
jgi:hypothetical protein